MVSGDSDDDQTEDIQLMAGFDKNVKVQKKNRKLNLSKEQRIAQIKQEKV